MTMAHGERMLRESGDPKDEVYADMLRHIRESRGSDIPLPYENEKPPTQPEKIGAGTLHSLSGFPDDIDKAYELPDMSEPEKKAALSNALKEMAQPFVPLIEARIPLMSEISRAWYGKKQTETKWKYTEQRGEETDVHYDFTVGFQVEHGGTTATELKMRRGPFLHRSKPYDIEVGLSVEKSGITTITVSGASRYLLEAMSTDASPYFETSSRYSEDYHAIAFNLDVDNISLAVSDLKRLPKRHTTYTYNAQEDIFEGTLRAGGGEQSVASRTTEEHMTFLSQILSMIPVKNIA